MLRLQVGQVCYLPLLLLQQLIKEVEQQVLIRLLAEKLLETEVGKGVYVPLCEFSHCIILSTKLHLFFLFALLFF